MNWNGGWWRRCKQSRRITARLTFQPIPEFGQSDLPIVIRDYVAERPSSADGTRNRIHIHPVPSKFSLWFCRLTAKLSAHRHHPRNATVFRWPIAAELLLSIFRRQLEVIPQSSQADSPSEKQTRDFDRFRRISDLMRLIMT